MLLEGKYEDFGDKRWVYGVVCRKFFMVSGINATMKTVEQAFKVWEKFGKFENAFFEEMAVGEPNFEIGKFGGLSCYNLCIWVAHEVTCLLFLFELSYAF